jgi:DUF1365 family protein
MGLSRGWLSIGHGGSEIAGGAVVMPFAPSREGDSPALPALLAAPTLYAAEVTHTRLAPIKHRFRYRASYWLVDYDQLPGPSGIVWRLARLERSDHSDVRSLLADHGIAADRILMLAMSRTLGYVFNPISVFWCFDACGARVAVVVEVPNTYGERHTYLLRPDAAGRSEVNKALYVSPFNPVDGRYEIRVSEPAASLSVTVTLHQGNGAIFVASLRAERRTASRVNVVRASFAHPAIRTAVLIRWQAARLWLRGLKVQPR